MHSYKAASALFDKALAIVGNRLKGPLQRGVGRSWSVIVLNQANCQRMLKYVMCACGACLDRGSD
jgi:hypothetical protein